MYSNPSKVFVRLADTELGKTIGIEEVINWKHNCLKSYGNDYIKYNMEIHHLIDIYLSGKVMLITLSIDIMPIQM